MRRKILCQNFPLLQFNTSLDFLFGNLTRMSFQGIKDEKNEGNIMCNKAKQNFKDQIYYTNSREILILLVCLLISSCVDVKCRFNTDNLFKL